MRQSSALEFDKKIQRFSEDRQSIRLDQSRDSHVILNLGCGNQRYGDIRVDKYKGSANLIADVEGTLPFKDEVFDVVYSRFLFEHLRNPSVALEEMIRVLRPKGRIILITDNAAYPPFYFSNSMGSGFHAGCYRGSGPEDRHYSVFAPEHLKNHLLHFGLEGLVLRYAYADDVGGKGGIWQKVGRFLRVHKISILKPFCMPNIVAVGTKPTKDS